MIIGTIGIQQWGAKHITGAAASYVLHWSSIWEWKGLSQKHGHWIKKVSRFHCETNAYFEPDSLQPDPASRRGSGLQAVDGWTQRRLPLGGAHGPGIKTPIVPSFIPPFGKKITSKHSGNAKTKDRGAKLWSSVHICKTWGLGKKILNDGANLDEVSNCKKMCVRFFVTQQISYNSRVWQKVYKDSPFIGISSIWVE